MRAYAYSKIFYEFKRVIIRDESEGEIGFSECLYLKYKGLWIY